MEENKDQLQPDPNNPKQEVPPPAETVTAFELLSYKDNKLVKVHGVYSTEENAAQKMDALVDATVDLPSAPDYFEIVQFQADKDIKLDVDL